MDAGGNLKAVKLYNNCLNEPLLNNFPISQVFSYIIKYYSEYLNLINILIGVPTKSTCHS